MAFFPRPFRPDRLDPRFSGKNTFGNDRAYCIAAGTKQQDFDAMIAYAYRKKGNYFSGKKGAEAYGYLDPDPQKNVEKNLERLGGDINNVSPKTTAVGLFYVPGGEVANTSLETKSWLGKFTYRLPARAAKPEIRHKADQHPLWRSHAFAHSQRQRLSGRQLRHYVQDCRMAVGMGQTTRLQYRLHMETAKQPLARPASLAVGDAHQIQNQLRRRRARRCCLV